MQVVTGFTIQIADRQMLQHVSMLYSGNDDALSVDFTYTNIQKHVQITIRTWRQKPLLIMNGLGLVRK